MALLALQSSQGHTFSLHDHSQSLSCPGLPSLTGLASGTEPKLTVCRGFFLMWTGSTQSCNCAREAEEAVAASLGPCFSLSRHGIIRLCHQGLACRFVGVFNAGMEASGRNGCPGLGRNHVSRRGNCCNAPASPSRHSRNLGRNRPWSYFPLRPKRASE